jgi:hypothetical protein
MSGSPQRDSGSRLPTIPAQHQKLLLIPQSLLRQPDCMTGSKKQNKDSAQRIFCLADPALVTKTVLYVCGNNPPREEETLTKKQFANMQNQQNERKTLKASLQERKKQKAERPKVHTSVKKYTYLLQVK